MKDSISPEEAAPEQATRRAFFKTSSQVAITAPAVALLLSAASKPAAAATQYATVNGTDGGVFSADNDTPNDDTYVVPGDGLLPP